MEYIELIKNEYREISELYESAALRVEEFNILKDVFETIAKGDPILEKYYDNQRNSAKHQRQIELMEEYGAVKDRLKAIIDENAVITEEINKELCNN